MNQIYLLCCFIIYRQAFADILYDSFPDQLYPSYTSEGVECCGIVKQGGELGLQRSLTPLDNLQSFEIIMVNWAKYSDIVHNNYPMNNLQYNSICWEWPITLELYKSDGTTLLGTWTEIFQIPWRPPDNVVLCPDTGECGTSPYGAPWYSPWDDLCHCGFTFTITFNLYNQHITSSVDVNDIVFAISYNTQTAGPSPVGIAGPYNSLNVGLIDGLVAKCGFQPTPYYWGECLVGSAFCLGSSGFLCDTTGATGGEFVEATGCTGNTYTYAVIFQANPPVPPPYNPYNYP